MRPLLLTILVSFRGIRAFYLETAGSYVYGQRRLNFDLNINKSTIRVPVYDVQLTIPKSDIIFVVRELFLFLGAGRVFDYLPTVGTLVIVLLLSHRRRARPPKARASPFICSKCRSIHAEYLGCIYQLVLDQFTPRQPFAQCNVNMWSRARECHRLWCN